MKTLPFQGYSGMFFSELSSRIWTCKAILYFNCHRLVCLKKLVRGSPPSSSSCSLSLCFCLPCLVISFGFDHWREVLYGLWCCSVHVTGSIAISSDPVTDGVLLRGAQEEVYAGADFSVIWCVFCLRHFFMPPALAIKLPCFRIKNMNTWLFCWVQHSSCIFANIPWII